LFSSDSNLPKTYGLPKIHKKIYLFESVPSVNTALYPIAKFIHKLFMDSLIFDNRHVNNSFELIKSLSNIKLDTSDVLISLFVIHKHPSSNGQYNKKMEKDTTIPFDEFVSTVNFILSSTYFIFNIQRHIQTNLWHANRITIITHYC